MTKLRTLTAEEREELEAALSLVQDTQTALWDALSDLESLLEGVELDANTDYEGYSTDDLLEMELGHFESCPKCGAQVLREDSFVDEGTGEEAGRTFYYCSEHCRETH